LQQEKILEAKTDSLDSDRIIEAMVGRAEWEADQLANKILGDAAQQRVLRPGRPGFASASTDYAPKSQRR
jgi:hypothetical protein